MLAALVPPGLGHKLVPTRRAQVCDMYQSGYIPPLQHTTFFQKYTTFFGYERWYILYRPKTAYITKNDRAVEQQLHFMFTLLPHVGHRPAGGGWQPPRPLEKGLEAVRR